MNMSKGLAALVEGRARIPSEWNDSNSDQTGTSETHAEKIDATAPEHLQGNLMPEAELDARNAEPEEDEALYKGIFARASNLLRESLDVDYALFVDTGSDHGVNTGARKAGSVNLVGFSRNNQSTVAGTNTSFTCDMRQAFLSVLCQRYHDGKIWSYHEDGSLDYDDETAMSLSSKDERAFSANDKPSKRSEKESEVLLRLFPGSRQILFAPLWDSVAGLSNPEYFSGCFGVSTREVPVFTTEIEVAFVRAFVNSIGVICGHLAAAFGEKQKSQFISSMSHELRSPLHGILASTELLYGTPLSVIQTDLCDTVDLCGQTLLDTLSQILDYSKVNNFLRDTHKATESDRSFSQPSGHNTDDTTNSLHAGSSLHIYSECDIASLCEEALDVISMSFHQESSPDSPNVTPFTEFGNISAAHKSADESVAVDFRAPNEDWAFLCSPGAIRRIVMNLVGNSFKYTEAGSISVRLSMRNDDEHGHKDKIVTICVTDTGKGMSEGFMRHKLFVPFSQESSVTPGSGLGLSLVQGIIKSLDGKIDVWSKVGKGTKMEVNLPLKRAPKHSPYLDGQLTPAVASWLDGKTFRFFTATTGMHSRVKDSIRFYMGSWWKVKEADGSEAADIVFLDALDLPRLLEASPSPKIPCYGVVLSRMAALPDVRSILTPSLSTIEPLRIPFGPKKLLKTLQASKKRSSELQVPSVENTNGPSHSEPASADKHIEKLTPGALRLRLDPENRRNTAAASTATLPIWKHALPRQLSQPVTQLEGGPAVLCVDDNAINLKLLNTFAKKLGFENIESAEDGLQAFQAAEKHVRAFDVIFMDLTMPVMDGFESTKRIRKLEGQRKRDGEDPRPSIIIALTGLASDEDQNRAFAAGVDHFVTKPLRFKDLKQMLSQWNLDGALKGAPKEVQRQANPFDNTNDKVLAGDQPPQPRQSD